MSISEILMFILKSSYIILEAYFFFIVRKPFFFFPSFSPSMRAGSVIDLEGTLVPSAPVTEITFWIHKSISP